MSFPDYMISVDDCRFNDTWDRWSAHLVFEMCNTEYTQTYLDHLDMVVRTTYTHPAHLQIPKDILRAVKDCEKSCVDTVIIGYDASYCDYHSMNIILINYMNSRRRKDYTLACTSAFALTQKVNEDLLDYAIPNLNLVAITYLHK